MSLIFDPGVSLAGCTPALVSFYVWLNDNVDGLRVSSTKRSGTTSYHDIGQAIDLAAGFDETGQQAYDAAIRTLVLQQTTLAEGIHQANPGHISWSIKYGKPVPYSYWGSTTWNQHLNHIHAAVPRADFWVPVDVPKPPAPKPITASAIVSQWW